MSFLVLCESAEILFANCAFLVTSFVYFFMNQSKLNWGNLINARSCIVRTIFLFKVGGIKKSGQCSRSALNPSSSMGGNLSLFQQSSFFWLVLNNFNSSL